MPEASPYTTVERFGRSIPAHISDRALEDGQRVRAYETYADIFHNVETIFTAVLLDADGQEMSRRYIPSARSLIEASNRYLGQGLTWVPRPATATSAADPLAGADADAVGDEAVSTAMGVLQDLFDREMFVAKFLSMKRWMLVRGDGMLHITGDLMKPEGSRLRITELNPSAYFPIRDPGDAERVVGCYIVNIIKDDAGEEIVARLEYQRVLDEEASAQFNSTPVGSIFMRMTFWELDGWDDRESDEDLAPVRTPRRFNSPRFESLLTGGPLDPRITAIPIYHFRNNARGGAIFGTSQIQGVETLLVGISQTATDQEIAIALQGLGVYWTDSGKPRDAAGNETEWVIAPAGMLEVQEGKKIGRVNGITSIEPSLDHIGMLKNEARETTGTPALAVGLTPSERTASSGVALSIEMAPILVQNMEKELELAGKLNQFLFDLLNGWLPAYEGWAPNGVTVKAEFENPMPIDRKAIVEELERMVLAKVLSAQTARQILTDRLGYVFPSDEGDLINTEASAMLDATGARLDQAVDEGAEVGL